jgi:hypothetical protein
MRNLIMRHEMNEAQKAILFFNQHSLRKSKYPSVDALDSETMTTTTTMERSIMDEGNKRER